MVASAPATGATASGNRVEVRRYRNDILAMVQRLPYYTGAQWRRSASTLTVWAKGEPTPALTRLFRSAPVGITVRWGQAPYTASQLDRESLRIMRNHRAVMSTDRPENGRLIRVYTDAKRLLNADNPEALLGTVFPVRILDSPRFIPAGPA